MLTFRRLVTQSLRFHWRSHLGVVLGAAVGSAALIGALVVGDSVRESLLDRAARRLGGIDLALASGDRLFGADIAERLGPSRGQPQTPGERGLEWGRGTQDRARLLNLRGTASRQDGSARAHEVQIIGYTPAFWGQSPGRVAELGRMSTLAPPPDERPRAFWSRRLRGPEAGKAWINAALAAQLSAKVGDTLIVRFAKPSALSQEAVLSPRSEAGAALRLVVDEVLGADDFGEFSLRTSQRPALNLFLNEEELWRASGVTGQANVLLVGRGQSVSSNPAWRGRLRGWLDQTRAWIPAAFLRPLLRSLEPARSLAESEATLQHVTRELDRKWKLSDAGIDVRVIEQPAPAAGGEWVPPMVEIATGRIFLDRPVVEASRKPRTTSLDHHIAFGTDSPADVAAASYVTNGIPILTYLANALRAGDRLTPYSMVSAVGPPWTAPDLRDDEIVVNEWLAKDLGVKTGDRVTMEYFDPEAGARLVERTNAFTVRSVVPVRGLHADRTLMPEFPGLAKAESTSDWDAGFPLAHKIRDEDEAYWKLQRGTPKAFVTLAAGRGMWGNRFGDTTAVRYPVPTNGFAAPFQRIVEANLLAQVKPSDVGLVLRPVRDEALKAATSGQDFGQLFLGFSFFLVVAALLLMALLFQFGLEQRLPEIGTLLALGFRPRTVRWLWLGEGVALASAGSIVGVAGGLYYAQAMIHGLTTLWRDAVAGAALEFHATPGSVFVGLCASVIVCGLTLALTLRRQFARPARELLAGELPEARVGGRSRGWRIGIGALAAALALVGWAAASGRTSNAGVFFGAGSLLLIAGLALAAGWLARLGDPGRKSAATAGFTAGGLAMRGTARRRSRSLATAGLLACGTFLIAAIGAFRMDAQRDAWRRDSGTGGFAWIGETSLPVTQDLNTARGLEAFGLAPEDLAGVSFVPFRVRDGDDASCLNLNRAQRPRLLGVEPRLLAGREAFAFAALDKALRVTNGWQALDPAVAERDNDRTKGAASDLIAAAPEIPAIGDAASIQWALGKKIGDTMELADERGRPFRLRLVGGLANSILQGSLIIDDAAFRVLFPGESGHRWFLIDAPTNRVAEVGATLSRALENEGLEMTLATRRLAQFNAVQNTYLTTFQILGGLGLLLGSAGLGVVVLRNVLERRGELALLTAVGFRRRAVARLVLVEHAALLLLGLGIGLTSAGVAVLPSLLAPEAALPFRSLGWTLGGVLVLGLLATWAAVRGSLRGSLLGALRGE